MELLYFKVRLLSYFKYECKLLEIKYFTECAPRGGGGESIKYFTECAPRGGGGRMC